MLSMPRAGVLCAQHRRRHKRHVPSYCVRLLKEFDYSALQRLDGRRVNSIFGGALQHLHARRAARKSAKARSRLEGAEWTCFASQMIEIKIILSTNFSWKK